MNRLITLAAAALLLAGGVAFWQSSSSSGPTGLGALGMAEAQNAAGEVDTSMIREMVMGDPDAPLTVIEYASFTCPHCRAFHENVFGDLKKNYIDTGKVKLIYREVYFDRYGLWAGMVARCGSAEDAAASETAPVTGMDPATRRYFAISDMIYEKQADWSRLDSTAAIADALTKIGVVAGLNEDDIEACLRDVDKAQAMVALYQKNAEADGITGTPSFMIDGTRYSNMSYAEFSKILDEKLGG